MQFAANGANAATIDARGSEVPDIVFANGAATNATYVATNTVTDTVGAAATNAIYAVTKADAANLARSMQDKNTGPLRRS